MDGSELKPTDEAVAASHSPKPDPTPGAEVFAEGSPLDVEHGLGRGLEKLETISVADDSEDKFEQPSLKFLPFEARDPRGAEARPKTSGPWLSKGQMGIAASLALVFALGGGAIFAEVGHSREISAKIQENKSLAANVGLLKERLDALEAGRGKEELMELRKLVAEMKQGTQASREFGVAVGQLSARVEHIERDQTARIEKINEKLDKDSTAKLAEIASRLDKLEKRAPAPVVAAVPAPSPKPAAVSNETTGSIEKPLPRLRGYSVEEVRDGYAIVDSRDGAQSVAPGDFIPGAGKVMKIERRGREWVVVTNLGLIGRESGYY